VSAVADNLRAVMDSIEAAAKRSGRDAGNVRLVVVSKTVAADVVNEAVAAGAKILGENRVQEALPKMEAVGAGVAWHLIGTLQKNKAKHAVGAFELIHSLDGIELARELARQAVKRGIVQDALIEVNVAGESTKHGVGPDAAMSLAREAAALSGLRITGLMCIPPFTENPEDSRPYFRRLKGLLKELNDAGFPMSELSMGMTQDYEVAVEEGATLVRVGTAIFGRR